MQCPVVSVKPRDSAAHARAVMEQHRINQLPVLEGPRLAGIVTDRDLRDAFPSLAESATLTPGEGVAPETIPVEDVMTRDVLTVEPETSLTDAARILRRERIGTLPVVSGGHLVGMLARSDLLEALVQLLDDEAAPRGSRAPIAERAIPFSSASIPESRP